MGSSSSSKAGAKPASTSFALPSPKENRSLAMDETDDMRVRAGRAEDRTSAHGLSSSGWIACLEGMEMGDECRMLGSGEVVNNSGGETNSAVPPRIDCAGDVETMPGPGISEGLGEDLVFTTGDVDGSHDESAAVAILGLLGSDRANSLTPLNVGKLGREKMGASDSCSRSGRFGSWKSGS
jgi:hypothetical protein